MKLIGEGVAGGGQFKLVLGCHTQAVTVAGGISLHRKVLFGFFVYLVLGNLVEISVVFSCFLSISDCFPLVLEITLLTFTIYTKTKMQCYLQICKWHGSYNCHAPNKHQ